MRNRPVAGWTGEGRLLLAAVVLLGPARALAQQLPEDGDERTIRMWAAPGMLRNPVAFAMDPGGNAYIAESDRAGEAVSDTRQLTHLDGVGEDLRLRTVEDRRALIARWVEQGAFAADYFTRTEDRVRLVRDTDGDGVADSSSVFAGGFNDAVDGIGAGVLWRDGEVYYTCIPNLWKLRDADGDGVAESREAISSGYGVRWCFYGHDLHGLVNGPDGRVYFSMGDRGFNVKTMEGRQYVGPDRGGVFRCWPDGSGLELFYTGLRNPQELAFDEFGNLFTGDNNCDSGDLARVVYVIEGGDSGWRQNVQSLPSRGPWNREHIWELLTDPRDPSRPAWALPPIDHVGAGPSGLAYYPGTGESHAYADTFLMVDFYGSGSTVHSFRAAPAGAGFRLTERDEYYKGTTVTDIAWGPDCRLYLSDWGEGWGPNDKGNIFTIVNDTVHADPAGAAAIAETWSLLGAGFADRGDEELLGLLGHADQRVRLGAQYELAGRERVESSLLDIAHDERAALLRRVHAIWCIGQASRRNPAVAQGLADLIGAPEEQIRVQAVRTLGDLRAGPVAGYVGALRDPSAPVRADAAIALGKLDAAEAVPALLDALGANDDHDVFLHHAIVHALELIDEPDAMIHSLPGRGRAARMGAVLALRRLGHVGLLPFLGDPDAGVATEAARAVYDLYLDAGLPALARRLGSELDSALMTEPFLRRAIEANVLLGGPEEAERLARFAANPAVPGEWRALAMERLAGWDSPLGREGVWGDLVELPARPIDDARRAVLANLEAIRGASAGDIGLGALADGLGAKYELNLDMARALGHLVEPGRDEGFRLVLLDQIAARAPDALAEACARVLGAEPSATSAALRMRARELLVQIDPGAGVDALEGAIASGEPLERQHAVRTAGTMDSESARALATDLTARLGAGEIDREIALEAFRLAASAAAGADARRAAESIAAIEPQRPAGFQTLLLIEGGDTARGRDVFEHHESAQCIRCHTVAGTGGTAGPELTTIGSRASRVRLAQSITEPGAVVTAGFGTVSAMPAMTQLLAPEDVRDLVAYLSSLTDPAIGPAPPEPAPAAASAPGALARAPEGDGATGSVSWTVALWAAGGYLLVLAPVVAWLVWRLGRRA